MKKFITRLACVAFILGGCVSDNGDASAFGNSHTIIDWVDFVVVNNVQYESAYSVAIADPRFIGKQIGEVKFRLKDNITDPSYTSKNGDAAYLEKGTRLFAVKGMPNFIAVKEPYRINGYKIYAAGNGSREFRSNFRDFDSTSVNKIEIYQDGRGLKLINTISEEKKVDDFLQILNEGETRPGFSPDNISGDPERYRMILYTGQPLAHNYHFAFDGTNWFWHPWDTTVLPKEIEQFMGGGS